MQPLAHPSKWQRVEQFLEPVVCRVVDVRVLTQVLMQPRRYWGFVDLETCQIVQRHQNDQTVLAHPDDVMIERNVEFLQTVRAAVQILDTFSTYQSKSVHFSRYGKYKTRAQMLLRWSRNVAQVEFSLSNGRTSI